MVGYSTLRSIGMKRTASVAKTSRSPASSQRRSKLARSGAMYVMCVYNKHNPASLQLRKVYRAMRDAEGGEARLHSRHRRRWRRLPLSQAALRRGRVAQNPDADGSQGA